MESNILLLKNRSILDSGSKILSGDTFRIQSEPTLAKQLEKQQ